MKTTNKIQKTALTAVAAAGLAIISFASNAQPAIKTLFEDIETNHIAMVMGKTNNNFGAITVNSGNSVGTNAFAAYLVTETEEPMELEDWMIDEANFATMALFEAESESPMEIEDWMLNEHYFDANSFSLEVETENEMKLENWMTNESNFDVTSFSLATETDNEMVLEDWMTNENIFDVKQEQGEAIHSKVNNKAVSTGTFIFSEVSYESELKIESWMINPSVWK
jgi:hypothetical protein